MSIIDGAFKINKTTSVSAHKQSLTSKLLYNNNNNYRRCLDPSRCCTYTSDVNRLELHGVVHASRVSPEHGYFDGDWDALHTEAAVHAVTRVFRKAHGFVNDLRHALQIDSLAADKRTAERQAD